MKLAIVNPGERLRRALRREWNRLPTATRAELEAQLTAGRAKQRLRNRPREWVIREPELRRVSYYIAMQQLAAHGVHPGRKLAIRGSLPEGGFLFTYTISNQFRET